ncbi:MAG TPA: alpha/beta hydrolase family protein [Solirubrobacteraceae bacterium]|jgi:S-formylglutathione hydrolase FrmB
MSRVVLLVVAAVLAVCAPAAGAVQFRSGDGLTIASVKQVNPRLVALVVKTKAIPDPLNVYVLFPPDYATRLSKRFPVFYLLHGTSGTASDWPLKGSAQQVIGDRELITVMPDIATGDGGGGWCSDWPGGAQKWETFHIDQLIPWIDSNLRTKAQRSGRAIAGLSQGGFCSMSYAARHPDLFSIALGYSGAPDIYNDPTARVGAKAVINATEVGLDQVAPDTFFGDQATDGINWAAHDPATIAENLRWTKMYMYWGNGQPGPFDTPSSDGAGPLEGAINYDNQDFEARIKALGIPAYFDPYGNGTHSWPYWTRDLQWSIDKITAGFAHPAPTPSPFTYTSADDAYSVYGWSVTTHRTAREFSTLGNASKLSFKLAGSGSGTVVTPAQYKPGARYRVTLSGDKVAAHTVTVAASRAGRLRIEVPLGPANPYQQDTVQAQAAGTAVYTTTVRIGAAPR